MVRSVAATWLALRNVPVAPAYTGPTAPPPVNAVAVKELTTVSRRADNAALLGSLPDLHVDAGEIVAGLEAERRAR